MPRDPFYATAAWRKTRAMVRRRDQQRCTNCGKNVRKRGAGIVHHIKDRRTHPDLALFLPNLRLLCWACHNAEHTGDRTGKVRAVIGADGFPVGSGWSAICSNDDE